MTTYGNTLTHETIQFENTDSDEMFKCFGYWFQTKEQEIGEYYTNDSISLNAIANFLVDNAQMMCCGDAHGKVLLPAGRVVEFKITRARFWDGDGGTNDVEVMGKVQITRTPNDEFCVALTFVM